MTGKCCRGCGSVVRKPHRPRRDDFSGSRSIWDGRRWTRTECQPLMMGLGSTESDTNRPSDSMTDRTTLARLGKLVAGDVARGRPAANSWTASQVLEAHPAAVLDLIE